MRTMIACFFSLWVLVACENDAQQQKKADFTFAKGVFVLKFDRCSDAGLPRTIDINEESKAYTIAIRGMFSCESEDIKPYLTLPIDRRATLVLPKVAMSGGFRSSCECSKLLIIRLEGRVDRGDVIYVTDETEVLGHVVVP